jgi:hypothetical protein
MSKWGIILLFLLSGCKSEHLEVPAVPEEVSFEKVKKQDFVVSVPGYGIYNGGTFQVNIEAEDSPLVQSGQKASVQLLNGKKQVACQVIRILRSVTAETKQGIAWLRPLSLDLKKSELQEGDFVYATITTQVKSGVLVIPRRAVFVRDSKYWAIEKGTDEKGKEELKAGEIQVGSSSLESVEVLSGLEEKQEIAVDGGIGFLYPDFRAASDD